MATILVTGTPSPPLTATAHQYHHRLRHILTQSDAVSISQLKQLHAHIVRSNISTQESLFLYSRLIHYSSLQDVNYTFKLFSQVPDHNTFVYNTLIRACAHSKEHKGQAFILFQELLKQECLLPDKHTFPFVLKACAYLFHLREGEQAHAQALKRGFVSDVYVSNSLVHFYSTCGYLSSAKKVFDKMPDRSLVSWNVMIDALVHMGEFDEALRVFSEMGSSPFKADGYTVQSVIDACAGLGALYLGMWIHAYVLKNRHIARDFDVLVNNSLIEMYCKCGALALAVQVFKQMSIRDINSWNSMILGFSIHGEANKVFDHFDRMLRTQKLRPNSITFVGVLSACNHRGLVNEGRKYFDIMVNDYNIEPVLQHYGCLIDLLARNGQIDEAIKIVSIMPMKPDAVIWRSLLDACCKQSKDLTNLSEEIAKHVMTVEGSESKTSGDYVLLSRVYASAKRWNDVGLIRKMMTDKGVHKQPGCSLTEINGVVHEFFAGDISHPQTKEIYEFLNVIEERLKLEGYVPDFSQAMLVDEADEGKGNSLRLHSERLAIAFGLMNSKPGVPVRVFKNLRVCGDCHEFTRLISKVFRVEIIMRDRLRFHHFRGGSCSCMGFW